MLAGAGSRATCSWSRWTTSAGGTATTTSSPTSCWRGCSTSGPSWCPELHRRASEWYAENGEPVGGDPHALAGGDVERRGRPGGAGTTRSPGGSARKACCAAGSRRCPPTSSGPARCSATRCAGSRLATADVGGVEEWLADGRALAGRDGRCRGGARPEGMVVANEQELDVAADLGRHPPRRAGPRPRRLRGDRGPRPATPWTCEHEEDLLAWAPPPPSSGWPGGPRATCGPRFDGVRRQPGDLQAGRARRRRHGARDHRRRPAPDRGPAGRRACAPTRTRWRLAAGGPPPRGSADMHVGISMVHLRAWRPGRGPPGT